MGPDLQEGTLPTLRPAVFLLIFVFTGVGFSFFPSLWYVWPRVAWGGENRAVVFVAPHFAPRRPSISFHIQSLVVRAALSDVQDQEATKIKETTAEFELEVQAFRNKFTVMPAFTYNVGCASFFPLSFKTSASRTYSTYKPTAPFLPPPPGTPFLLPRRCGSSGAHYETLQWS